MNDWNQNGKYDPADQYVDYKIYQDMTGTEDDNDTDCCNCCDCCGSDGIQIIANIIGYAVVAVLLLLAFNISESNNIDFFSVICGIAAIITGFVFVFHLIRYLSYRLKKDSQKDDKAKRDRAENDKIWSIVLLIAFALFLFFAVYFSGNLEALITSIHLSEPTLYSSR